MFFMNPNVRTNPRRTRGFFRDVSISRVPLSGLVSIKSEGDEGIEGREGLDQ